MRKYWYFFIIFINYSFIEFYYAKILQKNLKNLNLFFLDLNNNIILTILLIYLLKFKNLKFIK